MSDIPATQHAIQIVGVDEFVLNPAKPVDEVGPHQMLLKVEACGICFSDTKLLHAFDSHPRKAEVISGIAPEALADASCQGSVPCCRSENPAWIHGALYIVAYALRAVGHFHFRQSEAWDRADGEVLIA